MTYILFGIDLSLIWHGLEANFIKLQQKYAHIGLHFNAEKSEVLLFNSKSDAAQSIILGGSIVEFVDDIVYLRLPIGQSMLETWWLLLSHFQKRSFFYV